MGPSAYIPFIINRDKQLVLVRDPSPNKSGSVPPFCFMFHCFGKSPSQPKMYYITRMTVTLMSPAVTNLWYSLEAPGLQISKEGSGNAIVVQVD